MALPQDERDILDVFIINNLANIVVGNPFVSVPLGFQDFINTTTVNNLRNLNFPADIRELLIDYVLVQQLSNRRQRRQRLGGVILERRALI